VRHSQGPSLIKSSVPVAGRVIAFCGVFLVLLGFQTAQATQGPNLLNNGELTRAQGSLPEGWSSDAWQMRTSATSFGWRLVAGVGELEITNLQPNDARWIQKRHLEPGWYLFTGMIRVEGVARGITGANLSLLEDGIISEQLQGTTDWKQVALYLKVGSSGADVILACRLGGFAGLNTGKAFFRHLSLRRIDQPPTAIGNPSYVYDLDVIRHLGPAQAVATSEPNNAVAVMIVFLVAVATLVGLAATSEAGKRLLKNNRANRSADMPLRVSQGIEWPMEVILFLVCLATYAYFYQASDHNVAARIDLIRAIIERHTLWIENPYAGYNTADIVELGGHVYSSKAPGASFAGLLPWVIATNLARLCSLSADTPPYWTAVTYLTTLLTVGLASALAVVILYRLALYFGIERPRAVLLALTLACGTILFLYATEFTGEPLAACCELASFYVLATQRASWWWSLAAGLLAGWGVLSDFPTFVIALAIALFALHRLRAQASAVCGFVTGALAVAAILAVYNYLAFSRPFFLSYEAFGQPGVNQARFPWQAEGFVGITHPHLPVLWDILLWPQRGLLFCNPVFLLLPLGMWGFLRSRWRAEALTVCAAVIAMILLCSSCADNIAAWGGGTATGPRHLVPILPFLVLTLAFLPKNLNPLFAILAFVSVFLMLMATAVEPHLPYEYTNPFRDFLWPAFARGDFALNINPFFEPAPIRGDSAAFNLGHLAGLPGSIQLWPIAVLWTGAALYLLRLLGKATQFAQVTRLQIAVCVGILLLFATPTIGVIAIKVRKTPTEGLLGCYYIGLHPANGAPAHIRRVDTQISFDTIAELGALPSPSSVVWRGSLLAPVTGVYYFMIRADDLGWLKIDGKTIIADPGDVTKPNDAGAVELNAGEHSIETGERNIWGEASMHLDWRPPGGEERVVAPQFLIPDSHECRPG
jgi:hypothetical protein